MKHFDCVVIGGGDTGSDCVGTANRQGARSVTQIEVMPQPPKSRTEDYAWPRYPLLLKTNILIGSLLCTRVCNS